MFEKLAEKARETFYLEPQIYFNCRNELVVENCKRIEECTEVLVSLACGDLGIRIWGSSLRVDDFKSNGLVIHGKLSKVEFIERGKHKE